MVGEPKKYSVFLFELLIYPPSMSGFNAKTFKYFDEANKNVRDPKWHDENMASYIKNVKEPMQFILNIMSVELEEHLHNIPIHNRMVTRPKRPKNKHDELGINKDFSYFTAWEKKTSLFEYNPAIHFQIGHRKDDNFIGVGLYMVSSRQMKLMRDALYYDYENVNKIVSSKKFKSAWGEMAGEEYKRYPKKFDPEHPSSKFIKKKRFYFHKNFTRTEVKSKDFAENLIRDLKIVMPYFDWVREVVGTYHKK